MLYACLTVHLIVYIMLGCTIYAMQIDEDGEYTPKISTNFAVWLVKLPCAAALHFLLYPEVANGMSIMKFANNQCEQFVPGGSEISYVLGFLQVFGAVFCEGLNIVMLSN